MSGKAVFLDRDGVLNRETGDYIKSVDTFEVLPHVTTCLKILYDAGFLLIVITNQGGIAKGLYSKSVLNQMHEKLTEQLAANGIKLTEIFYCPHHPDYTNCLCRKPKSLLIEKAMSKYEINPSKSFMIGDTERDIQAVQNCGIHSFLIKSNSNWLHIARQITEIV